MKTKIILPFFLAIMIFSFSAYAAGMSCSIKDASACIPPNEAIVLRLSNLADGGSHVSTIDDPFYTKAVCCSGLPGLTSTKEDTGVNYKEEMVSTTAGEGHAAKTPIAGYTQINLTAPTEFTCNYAASCDAYDTCLFSISADEDAHISGCKSEPVNEYPFAYDKYCCRTGEAVCTITDIYWGVVVIDEETGEPSIAPLEGDVPLGPVGNDMDVFLIAETSGCEGTEVDFTIYNNDSDMSEIPPIKINMPANPPAINPIKNVPMGTLNGEPMPGYENVVIINWVAALPNGQDNWDYYFKAVVHKIGLSVTSDKSEVMNVYGGCVPDDNICSYFSSCGGAIPCLCGGVGQPECCGTTCPVGCPSNIDADCDGVDDCLDEFIGTVANPDEVNICSGTAAGTAGCIPSMDCTGLTWGACANCEAGQECEAIVGVGTMFMERTPCIGPEEGECDCFWDANRDGEPDVTAPPGCDLPGVLNQYNNRFKECIEEQEFPVFDGFNVVAVLLILSMYYAVVIIRKKK